MDKRYLSVFAFFLLVFATRAYSQQFLVNAAKKQVLDNISLTENSLYLTGRQKALSLARSRGWLLNRRTKNGGLVALRGVNSIGFPVYLITHNNTTAAATTSTDVVQPGGSLGLNLSGSSIFLNNKIAIWDGGWVYKSHQEFTGKTITLKDTSSVIDHATHVAGTMMAKGVYAPARGMAFNAGTLLSYDFNNDVSEMSKAAPGLLLSNHSYGDVAGWNYNETAGHWEWSGLPGDSLDYNFGFYNSRTQSWDNIAYNAPYYLIVESAGNSRDSNGPPVGADYYGYDSRNNQTLVDKGPRPADISNNDGYGIISTTGNAKNILTIGAVNPLPHGPTKNGDVITTSFSSWGPTDDGRIKPDLVADGVDVLSSSSTGISAYSAESGTSFSAPNVTGSLYLLQEYYAQKNSGAFMRAATLKGLVCHTAFDGGNPGPDYIYGWGLLNMAKAAQAITDNGTKSQIIEDTLQQGKQKAFTSVASGNGQLVATLSWTDMAAAPTPEGLIDNRTPKLINDLDIRITDGKHIYKPWVLDPANPSAAATTGDNIRDNIEQVYLADAVPGTTYTITISHKGTLQSGSQAYSLIITGTGGNALCASAPLSNADSRVNNFALANINNTPAAGCTGYSNYTNLTSQLEQGKTYPLSITLGTCGNNFDKAAKIYIDWNSNGIFDTNELVATTRIVNTTGTYSTNITVPTTVIPGNYSLMRVVLTETSDTSAIVPCGTYGKGETQDYRVQFLQTGTDAGVIAIVNPQTSGACNGTTPITVKIKNFGSQAISNIPISVNIKAPDNTITTINETYTGTLTPLSEGDFILSGTFNAIAGATYKITAKTNLAGDVVSSNDQTTASVKVTIPDSATHLSANFCVNSNQYLLTGIGDGELFWYNDSTDKVPFAYGSPVFSSKVPINNTYYAGVNDFSAAVGPATKNIFTSGGYNQFTPSVIINTAVPVILESARLYIGNSGMITFNVANSNGQIVASTVINATATRINPQPGAQADDPNDQGKVYNLNLLLPSAGKYTISAVYDNTATLYRNNIGVSGYPFKVGDIFSIEGNDASSGLDTTYKSLYYYFYNLQVKSAGCASILRKTVILSKPVITQTGAVLSSNFTDGNQWYLDDRAISGATSQMYSPLQSGNYRLMVDLNSACFAQSDNFKYVILSSNPYGKNEIGLTVFPVPTNNQLNVIFNSKMECQLNLSLINSIGKIVYANTQAIAAGNFSTVIRVVNQPAGTYLLNVTLGQKVYVQKIIIIR